MLDATAAAGALFVDEYGRVLLLEPVYKPGWDIPGGMVEPGESPAAACERELHEELGLHRPVRRLLVVDWAPRAEGRFDLMFVFDCGPLGDDRDIRLDPAEHRSWQWSRPDELDALLNHRLAPRIRNALRVRAGGAEYLEHGVPRS